MALAGVICAILAAAVLLVINLTESAVATRVARSPQFDYSPQPSGGPPYGGYGGYGRHYGGYGGDYFGYGRHYGGYGRNYGGYGRDYGNYRREYRGGYGYGSRYGEYRDPYRHHHHHHHDDEISKLERELGPGDEAVSISKSITISRGGEAQSSASSSAARK